MNNKIKNLLKVLIIIILIFCVGILYYVFSIYTHREYIIRKIEPIYEKKEKSDVTILDKVTFPYDVVYFNKEYDFNGHLDIKDNKLVLTKTYNNISTDKQLLDGNIKDIMIFNPEDSKMLFMYVLCDNSDLYNIRLYTDSLEDVEVRNIDTGDLKFKEFVKLDYNSYNPSDNKYATLVTEDGYAYIVSLSTLIEYKPKMLFVYDTYIVYDSNKFIATNNGKLLRDERKNFITAKYIYILSTNNNPFKDNPTIIFVTEDNRVVYYLNSDVYIYNKEIKDIVHESEDIKQNVKLKFKDGTSIKFNAFISEDYYSILNKN